MQQEVYADLYLLVNACMDLLCVWLTAALLHRRVPRRRAVLAAAFGGSFSLAALLLGADGIGGVLLDLAAGILLAAIAFAHRGERPRAFWRVAAVFLLTSALLGGVMTAIFLLLNRLPFPKEVLTEERVPVWMFALLAGVSAFLTVRGGRMFGFSRKTKAVSMTAVLFGKTVTLRAMVDSANLLRDPVTGKGVILAEETLLRTAIPRGLLLPVGNPARMRLESDPDLARRVCLIPAAGATGTALLTAFRPDSLSLTDDDGTHPCDCLIAPTRLEGRASGFEALLPAE